MDNLPRHCVCVTTFSLVLPAWTRRPPLLAPIPTARLLTARTHLLPWQRCTGHPLGPTYRRNQQVSDLGPTCAALCSLRPPFPSTPTHPAKASLSVLSLRSPSTTQWPSAYHCPGTIPPWRISLGCYNLFSTTGTLAPVGTLVPITVPMVTGDSHWRKNWIQERMTSQKTWVLACLCHLSH